MSQFIERTGNGRSSWVCGRCQIGVNTTKATKKSAMFSQLVKTIIIVLCASSVAFVSSVPFPADETSSAEYNSHIKRIAKARRAHDTKVFLEQKVSSG